MKQCKECPTPKICNGKQLCQLREWNISDNDLDDLVLSSLGKEEGEEVTAGLEVESDSLTDLAQES